MEPIPMLTKKYSILVNDSDFMGKVKLSSVFNFFQEIASIHADNLGLGMDTLVETHGVVWVLVRIRLDIIRYPLWKEDVILETWPQVPNRFEFERDFIIKDVDGNVIARAVSVWVMMDIQTRRLKKPEVSKENYPVLNMDRAINCTLGKLKPLENPIVSHKRYIGYSDIDSNGHLNNSKYLDFIMDSFTIDQHKKYETHSIQINYLNEVLPGDSIILYTDTSDFVSGKVYVEGVSEKNENTVFRALIEIKEA